jgi:GTPase
MADRLVHLITQMRWRLHEKQGVRREATYRLGVEDNGYPHGVPDAALCESIFNLKRMADANNVCARAGFLFAQTHAWLK